MSRTGSRLEVSGYMEIIWDLNAMYDVVIMLTTNGLTYTYDLTALKWKTYPGLNCKYLTLQDISQQIGEKAGVITVWQDTALWGKIYQYRIKDTGEWSTSGDIPYCWYYIGETVGFV
jgi:hypothetical protein